MSEVRVGQLSMSLEDTDQVSAVLIFARSF